MAQSSLWVQSLTKWSSASTPAYPPRPASSPFPKVSGNVSWRVEPRTPPTPQFPTRGAIAVGGSARGIAWGRLASPERKRPSRKRASLRVQGPLSSQPQIRWHRWRHVECKRHRVRLSRRHTVGRDCSGDHHRMTSRGESGNRYGACVYTGRGCGPHCTGDGGWESLPSRVPIRVVPVHISLGGGSVRCSLIPVEIT